ELGKPLRGLPHSPHPVATTTTSSFHVFNPDTQTGRRRVIIMTTIQTQRPTLVYVAFFYPPTPAFTALCLSRHSHMRLRRPNAPPWCTREPPPLGWPAPHTRQTP